VEGHNADRRSDIWSFGAVLYEMLTGKRAFEGETSVVSLASVMKTDPDWPALPKDTPAVIRTLIRRCLTKQRKLRLQAIGEARIVIEQAQRGVGADHIETPPRAKTSWLAWTLAVTFALAIVPLAY